jgi:hypothetical protein
VAVNFGRGPARVVLGSQSGGTGWRRLLGTHESADEAVPDGSRLELRAYEAIVLGRS